MVITVISGSYKKYQRPGNETKLTKQNTTTEGIVFEGAPCLLNSNLSCRVITYPFL